MPKCATARCASCASSSPLTLSWIGFVSSYQTPPKTFVGFWMLMFWPLTVS